MDVMPKDPQLVTTDDAGTAIATLMSIIGDQSAPPASRVRAAEIILDHVPYSPGVSR